MSIMQVHDEADFADVVLRDHVANAVFLFLPKIISTLLDVAKGDSKQGTIIISVSFWVKLLILLETTKHANHMIFFNFRHPLKHLVEY